MTAEQQSDQFDTLDSDLGSAHQAAFSSDDIWHMQQHLAREGYVKISDVLPNRWKALLRQDVVALTESSARRIDITVETTSHSPRRMKTVNFREINAGSSIIPALYQSVALRHFLNTIARSEVSDCDFDNERMTITRQEKVGDTHGWHWGDYQWALIFIIEAPGIDSGGLLQCVPHTAWDKKNPQVNRHLVEHPIRSYYHRTGDIYFFATDTTLHRTSPLEQDGTRIILNFTFAGNHDQGRDHGHETMSQIYDF